MLTTRNPLRAVVPAILFCFGSAALLGCVSSRSHAAPNANLCDLPEVIASKATPQSPCSVSLVPYREPGHEPVDATLVSVHAGMRANRDVISSWNRYFLDTPSKGLVALGEFPRWWGIASLVMFHQLGYDGTIGGGIRGRVNNFATTLIARQGDKFCSAVVMRPPFTGELIDCGEESKGWEGVKGEVGYMPGVLSQRQVALLVCERFAAERSSRCEHNVVYFNSSIFERDERGVGRYRVQVERSTRSKFERAGRVPQDYREAREYLVSVDGKAVHETSREWKLCVPNGGCPQIPGPPPGVD